MASTPSAEVRIVTISSVVQSGCKIPNLGVVVPQPQEFLVTRVSFNKIAAVVDCKVLCETLLPAGVPS